MAVTTVDVSELPNRFKELMSLANAGNEVIVTEGDAVRARLVPLPVGGTRILGLHPGSMEMSDDFDAPLPDEFWLGSS